MKIPVLLLGVFLSFNCAAIRPDSTAGKFDLAIKPSFGFVVAHRPALEPLQDGHVKSFELSIARTTSGSKDWENIFNFPEFGLTLAFFDLGSPAKLGKGIALYPFVDFPLSKNPAEGFHFRYGLGLGYVRKIFNPVDNIKNAAIGSHFNEAVHFDLHYIIKLSSRTKLEAGAGITHFSNGAFQLPNLGANIAAVHLAFHSGTGNKTAFAPRYIPGYKKTNTILVHGGGFLKSNYPPLGKKYFASVISSVFLHRFTLKSSWGCGADVFYDPSISGRFKNLGETARITDNFRPGIYGAYHLAVNKIGLMFNMGYYVYTSWKNDGNFYHRICLNYYLGKTFICFNLKSHYARADMFELGFGYRFGTN